MNDQVNSELVQEEQGIPEVLKRKQEDQKQEEPTVAE